MSKRKRAFVLAMPTMAQLVTNLRSGVRPGQVFRDKRRGARVNTKAAVRKESDRGGE